jgi:hypothetical protein
MQDAASTNSCTVGRNARSELNSGEEFRPGVQLPGEAVRESVILNEVKNLGNNKGRSFARQALKGLSG